MEQNNKTNELLEKLREFRAKNGNKTIHEISNNSREAKLKNAQKSFKEILAKAKQANAIVDEVKQESLVDIAKEEEK